MTRALTLYTLMGIIGSVKAQETCDPQEIYDAAALWTEEDSWYCFPNSTADVRDLIVYVNDGCTCEVYPPLMTEVLEGWFSLGCDFGGEDPDCETREDPRRDIWLSTFDIGVYEVTFDLYDAFIRSGSPMVNGRGFPHDNNFGRGTRPVINVNKYDAYAFCNWLSDAMGYEPVYAYDADGAGPTPPTFVIPHIVAAIPEDAPFDPYRDYDLPRQIDGQCWEDCHDEYPIEVNRDADGFRLPTEAEWEKAAAGGCDDMGVNCLDNHYPWGDECPGPDTPSANPADYRANFFPHKDDTHAETGHSDGNYCFDGNVPGATGGEDGFEGQTAPVGSFPDDASPYGCLDMAGNVYEWTQDWYYRSGWDVPGSTACYYPTYDPYQPVDDTGGLCPLVGPGTFFPDYYKLSWIRGGFWNYPEFRMGVHRRLGKQIPDRGSNIGFRIARRPAAREE